jgi:hypothetical protein
LGVETGLECGVHSVAAETVEAVFVAVAAGAAVARSCAQEAGTAVFGQTPEAVESQ